MYNEYSCLKFKKNDWELGLLPASLPESASGPAPGFYLLKGEGGGLLLP